MERLYICEDPGDFYDLIGLFFRNSLHSMCNVCASSEFTSFCSHRTMSVPFSFLLGIQNGVRFLRCAGGLDLYAKRRLGHE
jgi:hypothetical protein